MSASYGGEDCLFTRDFRSVPCWISYLPMTTILLVSLTVITGLLFAAMKFGGGGAVAPPTSVCDCPVKDYGLVSAIGEPFEPRPALIPTVRNFLVFTAPTIPQYRSSTNNSAKFSFIDQLLIYNLPTAATSLRLSGTAAGAIMVSTLIDSYPLLSFGIGWTSPNNPNSTTIVETIVVGPQSAGGVSFTIPFALILTRAQLVPDEVIILSMYVVSPSGGITFNTTAISILATEA